uniref:PDZ domain-containing protein n=2 Tax=Parascaris TaxID=6254 RepID=A0A915BPM0_PARUN
MSAQREIIKANWLQHKVRRKCGTLIRKKKIRYEEAEWVVLCVHNDRIPLLEWYFSEECSQAHRPSKVIDLLDSAFVTPVISDSRSFIIGFTHSSREPIELAALTPQDCSDWVRISMATLVRLRCINDSSNVYTALPDSVPMIYSNSAEEHPLEFSLDDEVPHSPAPAPPQESENRVSAYEHLTLAVDLCKLDTSDQNRSSESAAAEVSECARTMRRKSSCGKDIPPPLPPRDSTLPSSPLITSSRAGSVYDFPRNCLTPSTGMYGTLERHRHLSIASPSPVLPSTHSTTNSEYGLLPDAGSILSKEIAPPESEARVNVKRGYSIPSSTVVSPRGRRLSENMGCPDGSSSLKNNGYDVPQPATGADHFQLSPLVAPPEGGVGSTGDTSSAASPPTVKSSPPSLDSVYATPLGAHLKQLTPIALQLTLCVENVAFVEINSRIWVAGWTASSDKHLAGVLRVGDELVEVGGIKVEAIGQLPALFYTSSTPGSPVNLSIRRIPYGTEYTLIKTSRNYDFGVILRKHKNKLESVREGSPAFQAGLRAHITGMHGAICSACVTHFNGRPLSLFSKNDELLSLIDTVPPMSEFTLIIQPYDFMKEIKREIKKMKKLWCVY